MKAEIIFNCPKCGKSHILNVEDELDLTKDKSKLSSLLDDSYFSHECDNCKEKTVVEFPFIVKDDTFNYLYKLNPNDEMLFLLKDNEQREIRVVRNLNELKEKIRIKYFRLNDHVVEYIKKLIKEDIESNNEIKIDEIYFIKYEDEKLHFVLFDKENYLGSMTYSKEGYIKLVKELKEKVDKDLQIVNLSTIKYLF
jgi:predicted nucleic-acid-binding Zn-ribbon protein